VNVYVVRVNVSAHDVTWALYGNGLFRAEISSATKTKLILEIAKVTVIKKGNDKNEN
jgi:site-specific recombinase XerC